MKKMSRRSFVKKTAVAAGAVCGAGLLTDAASYARVIGANDKVRLALAGAGGRGGEHCKFFSEIPNVEFVWVVEPDANRAGAMAKRVADTFKTTPKVGSEYRAMLEDKDVDAVSVASCNHWHALMGIWACQADKDVFLEKPCSQNLAEGRVLIDTAEKTKRIVQHGTQNRSLLGWKAVAEAIRNEKYGKLIGAKVYCHRPRPGLKFKPTGDPPANLDWNQWIGPVAMEPYHANLMPYNWHWFWNTGNGEIGNNGVHYFDICRWVLGWMHPNSAISFGTRFVPDKETDYKDQAETPNIQFVLYDFNGIPLVYESCGLRGKKEEWTPWEKPEFYTDQGVFDRSGKNYLFRPNGGGEPVVIYNGNDTPEGYTEKFPQRHFENFINCVRDRDASKLFAPIREGHYSAGICHWGNVSYRTAEPAPLDKAREAMGDNPLMLKSMDSVLTNVQKVLDIDPKEIPFMLGKKLEIDVEKEKVTNLEAANAFLTRPPRAPFVA